MPNELPKMRTIGVVKGDNAPPEMVRTYQAKLSTAPALKDLVADYAFYSPAMIYLGNPLTFDPLHHFRMEYGQDVTPFSIRFNKPVFRNMCRSTEADQEWNHVLYGIGREHWDHLSKFLGSMAFTDRRTGRLTRIRTQEIEIADPLYFQKAVILPDDCPTVPITVFCLDTNVGCWYMKTGDHPLLDLPYVAYEPQAFADTKAFAKAIMRNNPNPYSAVDQANKEQSE